MELTTARYQLFSQSHAREVADAVRAQFRVSGERTARSVVTYHDTQDWRVHATGAVLRTTRSGRRLQADWCDQDERVVAHQPCSEEPGLARDLEPGSVTDLVAPAIGIRRALPLMRLHCQTRRLPIRDDDDKIVAQVHIMTARLREHAAADGVNVWRYVTVRSVRGYAEEFEAANALVAERAGLLRSGSALRNAAWAANRRQPGDYTSKAPVELDGSMRTDTAMKQIYSALLDVIVANEDGVRADLDPEFLHDFRTAVRRTRAALSQMKGVLPDGVVLRAKGQFRWLGQMTGPKRDSDVYLMKLPDYESELPRKIRQDLAPLRDYLASHDRFEHERLVAVLDSQRYRDWIKSWRAVLDRPDPKRPRAPNARRPIRTVAAERIARADRRVKKMGRAIKPSTEAEALHELRIDCKKLRYLIAFFKSLYPPKYVKGCLEDLSGLQDNLGDFNDLEVQQDALRRFGSGMRTEGYGDANTLLAMGWLVENLSRGQARERKRFEKRFRAFDTPGHHKRMQRLLNHDPNAAKA